MPRISEFFGIVIYMYWMDIQKHREPHFHARYKGKEAVYNLVGERLAGDLGGTVDNLVRKWCQENSGTLQEAWSCALKGKEIPWIKPLQ